MTELEKELAGKEPHIGLHQVQLHLPASHDFLLLLTLFLLLLTFFLLLLTFFLLLLTFFLLPS